MRMISARTVAPMYNLLRVHSAKRDQTCAHDLLIQTILSMYNMLCVHSAKRDQTCAHDLSADCCRVMQGQEA